MDGKKLISPEFRLTIKDYVITSGMRIKCRSSKKSKLDWAKVILESSPEDIIPLKDNDEAVLELGYDDDFDEIINGYLRRSSEDSWKELIIKDDLKKLEEITVKGTFLDCEPQDIIRYILTVAGIDRFELDQTRYPKKDRAVIKEMNGLKAISEVGALWGISRPFYFKNKVFKWGIAEEQKEVYILEEGETLMSLQKSGVLWKAEVIAIPWLHHSQEVMISHKEYTGMVEIEEIEVQSEPSGIKMFIWFRG